MGPKVSIRMNLWALRYAYIIFTGHFPPKSHMISGLYILCNTTKRSYSMGLNFHNTPIRCGCLIFAGHFSAKKSYDQRTIFGKIPRLAREAILWHYHCLSSHCLSTPCLSRHCLVCPCLSSLCLSSHCHGVFLLLVSWLLVSRQGEWLDHSHSFKSFSDHSLIVTLSNHSQIILS